MSVIRSPLRSPIYSPLYNPLAGKWAVEDVWTPAALFSTEEGDWWEIHPDYCRSLSDGTGAVAVGEAVGWVEGRINSNHLIQATADNRPILRETGGLYYLEFDDSNDFIGFTIASAQSQPTTHIHVGSKATGTDSFFNGSGDAANIQSLGQNSSSQWIVGAGITVAISDHFTDVSLWSIEFSGATSWVRTNGTEVDADNYGTNAFKGMNIAANRLGTSPAPVNYYGGMVITRALTSAELSSAETYFAAKGSVTL